MLTETIFLKNITVESNFFTSNCTDHTFVIVQKDLIKQLQYWHSQRYHPDYPSVIAE